MDSNKPRRSHSHHSPYKSLNDPNYKYSSLENLKAEPKLSAPGGQKLYQQPRRRLPPEMERGGGEGSPLGPGVGLDKRRLSLPPSSRDQCGADWRLPRRSSTRKWSTPANGRANMGPLAYLHMLRDTEDYDDTPVTYQSLTVSPQRSPSKVEERFLKLPESADYEKILSFGLDESGELVKRGYCYRRKSDLGPSTRSSPSTRSTASLAGSERGPTPAEPENGAEIVKQYKIFVLGAETVGKTSLIEQFQNCDLASSIARENQSDSLQDADRALRVLVSGQELDLFFKECDVDESLSFKVTDECAAAVVMYSVNNKYSFSVATDILNQVRDRGEKEFPIFLVANKMDLQRQRLVSSEEGVELAESFDCKFVEVSVDLGCDTADLLKELLLDLHRVDKKRDNNNAFLDYIGRLSKKHYRKKSSTAGRSPSSSGQNSRKVSEQKRSPKKKRRQSVYSRIAKSCEDVMSRIFR